MQKHKMPHGAPTFQASAFRQAAIPSGPVQETDVQDSKAQRRTAQVWASPRKRGAGLYRRQSAATEPREERVSALRVTIPDAWLEQPKDKPVTRLGCAIAHQRTPPPRLANPSMRAVLNRTKALCLPPGRGW
jgi:hypothetical protein